MIKLGQNQANNNNKDNHGEVATTTMAEQIQKKFLTCFSEEDYSKMDVPDNKEAGIKIRNIKEEDNRVEDKDNTHNKVMKILSPYCLDNLLPSSS